MSPACAPMARMARGDAGVEGCCDESGVAASRAATTTPSTSEERRRTTPRLRAHPDRLDAAVVVLQDLDEGRLLLGHAHGPGLRHADAMSEPAAPGDESGELLRVLVQHGLYVNEGARQVDLRAIGVDVPER